MNRTMKIGVAAAALTAALFCGYLYGKRATPSPSATAGKLPPTVYSCPMHPFIVKEDAGACAICAMSLVRKMPGAETTGVEFRHLTHVALSPAQQVMANLSTVTATVQPFAREIAATGIVTYDQERQGKVTAWVAGRLDRLHVGSVGARVEKGRPVADISSYDIVLAQEEYLLARKALKLFQSSIVPVYTQNSQTSLFEARQRLRQLGFREEQFEQLERSGKPTVRIPLISPVSGVVTEKFIAEGQYVNVGDQLFSVADLSRIWVELEIFEGDIPSIRKGQEVAITAKSDPGRLFRGQVSFIYPFLDPKTRTVRVRVTLPNPGLLLKPDMFVAATLRVPLQDAIVVPVGAVMDSGKRQLVWVEAQRGVFVPREVKAGARSAAGVQILAGLNKGEKVAFSGGYLIDSEAQLGLGGDFPTQPAPSPAGKDDMDMGDLKMPASRR